MKKNFRSHRKILTDLFRSRGKLDSYTLFKRSRLSFFDFSNCTRYLFEKDLATEVESSIVLTEKGRELILWQGNVSENYPEWRRVPEEYKSSSTVIDEPYVPDINLLDKSTFKIIDPNVD